MLKHSSIKSVVEYQTNLFSHSKFQEIVLISFLFAICAAVPAPAENPIAESAIIQPNEQIDIVAAPEDGEDLEGAEHRHHGWGGGWGHRGYYGGGWGRGYGGYYGGGWGRGYGGWGHRGYGGYWG